MDVDLVSLCETLASSGTSVVVLANPGRLETSFDIFRSNLDE